MFIVIHGISLKAIINKVIMIVAYEPSRRVRHSPHNHTLRSRMGGAFQSRFADRISLSPLVPLAE